MSLPPATETGGPGEKDQQESGHLGLRCQAIRARSQKVDPGATKDAQRLLLLWKKGLAWTLLEAGTSQGWKQAVEAAVKQKPSQRECFACHSHPVPCERRRGHCTERTAPMPRSISPQGGGESGRWS